MFEIRQIGGVLFLVICTYFDMKTKMLPVCLLVMGGLGVSISHIIQRENWWIYVMGILLGAAFLLVSKVTKEGLGYGDSILILLLGAFVGLWQVLLVLVIAFVSAAIFSSVVLVLKKMSRKKQIPFVPFLLLGYIGGCLL